MNYLELQFENQKLKDQLKISNDLNLEGSLIIADREKKIKELEQVIIFLLGDFEENGNYLDEDTRQNIIDRYECLSPDTLEQITKYMADEDTNRAEDREPDLMGDSWKKIKLNKP